MKTLLRLAILHMLLGLPVAAAAGTQPASDLTVMTWNIWHGGREDGDDVGPKRVVEVIRASGADLVAMQETYGSGERVSSELGFHFHPRGTNVSIHSRYPVIEDLSVFEEFQCVGALIELPDGSHVAFYSIWLPYDDEIWEAGTRDSSKPEALLAACNASARSLEAIRQGIRERLSGPRYVDIPVIVAGDFNSMSHLDYGEIGYDQYGAVVDWPTGHVLTRDGFRDSYRECNPSIERARDSTWSPRSPEQEQDRIDFIYYHGQGWQAHESSVVRTHTEGFPSDHAALVSVLRREPAPAEGDTSLRAVSYNIRHGVGMDGQLDLERTANVLRELEPDFVGLQEVDLRADRSASVNQALELGRQLDMHAAFGSFMEFQGGRYGMAILSRHPIVDVRPFDLPTGNEPRIALIAEVRLPGGETILVVNVHFDWVADDAFRFAQASRLADHLRGLATPFLLLGDFNDRPGSRTLELFNDLASEATKPREERLTFPADGPTREIDFLFHAPADSWRVSGVRVIDEMKASDHRPIMADLHLRIR